MTDAVVYMLYSRRPLSTAANQQLVVSTGTIATYFGNLAPPCGCLHAVVHELCVRQLSSSLWLFTCGGSRTLCLCVNWRYRHLTGAPIGPKGLRSLRREITCDKMGISAGQITLCLEMVQKMAYATSESQYNDLHTQFRMCALKEVVSYFDGC